MKRLLIVTVAVAGLAACTSNPYKPAAVEPRKPNSALSDSVSNVSDAALGLASETIHASIQTSRISANSLEDIQASDNGILGPFSTSAGASKDIAIVGGHVSKKATAVVVVSASETSKLAQASVDGVSQIFTTSGEILSAALNDSKNAIGVSVDFSGEKIEDSRQLIVKVGGHILGTVKLSSAKAKEISEWTPEREKKEGFSNWSVDKSGNLYYQSKGAVGVVLDTSGDVVSFIVDGPGRILAISKETVSAVVKSSSQLISDLATASAQTKAGKFLIGTVLSSAQKSVVYVKWSGHQSLRASKFVFNSSRDLLHSTPETRPETSAPGSSATAPATGSSQPN